jgi:hypothetical protein
MTQRDEIFSKNVILISKEAGLAATCIEQGLTSLRKANFTQKWNYYQSFFLLSIGLERLLKLTIVTIYRVEKNNLPDNGELKSYGHDIEKLYLKVTEEIDKTDNFINDDELYLMILKFLSEFARSTRYYNLDSLSGSISENDPLHRWKQIQNEIVKRHCKPIKISKDEMILIKQVNLFSSVIHTDESDTPIDNFLDFYLQGKNLDKVQGYSVFYIFKIISHLVKQLNLVSSKVYTMPVLSEFFPLFGYDGMSESEIVRKKDWNYLSNSR